MPINLFRLEGGSNRYRIASNKRMKRVALIAAGWVLLLLGVAGLFLPILPGVLLLIVALSILSVEYRWARRWMISLRRRFPATDKKLRGILSRQEKPSSA